MIYNRISADCHVDLPWLPPDLFTANARAVLTPRLGKEAIMKIARFSVLAGALAAVICSSALETAAQQEPILGCVKPGTGLLRIPPRNQGCKAGETPLGFNDLPLLVALRDQVKQPQAEVKELQERLAKVEACTDRIPECNPD